MKLNSITMDENQPYSKNRRAAINQEKLIDERYELIKNINDLFQN